MKDYQLVVTEATHLYGRLLDHVHFLKSFLFERNKTSVVKYIYIYIYIYIYMYIYIYIYIYVYIYIYIAPSRNDVEREINIDFNLESNFKVLAISP